MTASELMEQGIRAYTRGQLGEAERCWRDVLAVDPSNARAQSYLELLVGKLVGGASSPPQAAAVPLPAPAPAPSGRASPPPARVAAPVPLPAPSGPPASPPRAAPSSTPSPPPVPSPGPPPSPRDTPADRELGHPLTPDADWMRPPTTLPPTPSPVAADEFASCWDAGADEITTPITIAETLPEPAAAPSAHEAAPGGAAGFADFDVVGSPDAPGDVAPSPTSSGVTARQPSLPRGPAPGRDERGEGPKRATLSEYAPSPWDEGPAAAPAVVLDDGIGLDLATVAEQSGLRSLVPEATSPAPPTQAPRSEVEIWMEGARELFALGDFSGSLEMIEKILKIDPSHAEAREYLKQNEATLIAMYESKLGPADAVPKLAIQPEEVMWLNLDHRAGFLLAQIDGSVSYEDLFALSGLPRLDTARILAALLHEGVISS